MSSKLQAWKMNLFAVLSVSFVSFMALQLGDAYGPFDFTNNNTTKELGSPTVLSILKKGARRGIEECQNQFKNDNWLWNCSFVNEHVDPDLPIFVNTTLPYATPETAFVHAISSAGITYEAILQCRRNNIPGCKCLKEKPLLPKSSGTVAGCGDNIEFGQKQTRRFFEKLEKGNDARMAVNLHNNEVGRQVVGTSLLSKCKCYRRGSACDVKTCRKLLAPFKDIGAELKQKYRNAVRVWFLDNKLQERIGDRFKAISSEDNRLVYLDPSPNYCVRNDDMGFPGMLGRTCLSDNVTNSDCKSFISLCKSCKLKPETVTHYMQVKCGCKFHWCCYVKCDKTCTKGYLVTTCNSPIRS